MRLAIAGVLVCVLAAGCRDRAAAAAAHIASGGLAKVDPRALRTELDLALSARANRHRPFMSLCEAHLPFVTHGAPITFAGATNSGDAYTYQTRSDRPCKQADNSFVVAIHDPPHAPWKVRFSAICLDCLASGSSSE